MIALARHIFFWRLAYICKVLTPFLAPLVN